MNIKHKLLSLAVLLSIGTFAWAQGDGGSTAVPHIGGSVFGGGRMADVDSTTHVDVYKSTIDGSVFGGNDITGHVNSSTVIIHVHMNDSLEVYGGGNGYYDYSGNYDGMSAPVIANTSVIVGNATYTQDSIKIGAVYGGAKNADVIGTSCVTVESGTIDKVFGGNNYGGSIETTDVSLKGGKIYTAYGGGNKVNVDTSNIRILEDVTVGTAFAGGNDATATKAANLYLDCDGTRSTSSDYVTDSTMTPNVGTIFGGNNIADMTIVPWMELHRGSVRTVFGGGNEGSMLGHDALFVDGSKVLNSAVFTGSYPTFGADKVLLFAATDVMIDSKYKTNTDGTDNPNDGLIVGEVYGGCKQADVNNSSYMRITHAQYIGNVYGGCDISGSVGFKPGTLTSDMLDAEGKLQVFSTNGVNGTVGVSVDPSFVGKPLFNASTFVYMNGGTVHGNVYGGGNGDYGAVADGKYTNGDYSGIASPFVAATTVNIEKGTIKGNLYGGGNKADVGYVYPEAGSYMGKDYAAGDMLTNMSYIYMGKGAESSSVNVEGSVYGGCKNASVYGSVDILALKDVQINNLFAGNDISGSIKGNWRGTRFSLENMNMTSLIGTGTDAQSRLADTRSFYGETLTGENANVYVRVMPGANITHLFGGSNGDYGRADSVGNYAEGEYMGLPKPAMHSTFVDVAGNVGTIYGGGNAADIDNTHVCLYGPAVVGTSEVPGAVYGGCKSADVTHATQVQMIGHGTDAPLVYGNVFGGCDISGNVGDCTLGCTHADGTKNADVHLSMLEPDASTVAGHTLVNILAGRVTNRVFGGGNGLYDYADSLITAPVCQNTYVSIRNAVIGDSVSTSDHEVHTCFGGGQGAGTKVLHNVYTLVGDTIHKTRINGILYGGSYAGIVNSTCDDITKTVLLGYGSGHGDNGNRTQVLGSIYGGSYGNHVRGEISLNVKDVTVGVSDDVAAEIYAGNNNAGQPECVANVNYVGNDCNIALYGGGNKAPFYGTTRLTFTKGTVGYLYGGGNHAPVYGNTIVEVLGGHVCHDVFGGGNEGDVKVNTEDPEHPYGGNTVVIVRDDCLKLDDEGKFEKEPFSGNYLGNYGDNFYSNKFFSGNDLYAADKGYCLPKPNHETNPVKSSVVVEGNIYGGGNNADVEGKTTVIIGDKKE